MQAKEAMGKDTFSKYFAVYGNVLFNQYSEVIQNQEYKSLTDSKKKEVLDKVNNTVKEAFFGEYDKKMREVKKDKRFEELPQEKQDEIKSKIAKDVFSKNADIINSITQ